MPFAFPTLKEEVMTKMPAYWVNSELITELTELIWTIGWVNQRVNSWTNLWVNKRVHPWVNEQVNLS